MVDGRRRILSTRPREERDGARVELGAFALDGHESFLLLSDPDRRVTLRTGSADVADLDGASYATWAPGGTPLPPAPP